MNRRLLLILALALAVRVVGLATRNLWYDEAFAVLFAEKGLDAMLYGTLSPVEGGASDIHPLLYYSTLNLWMSIFGQSAVAVRLWNVVLGLATVYVMYHLGRTLFGEKTGLATALICALAPFHVQYSQEVRMYALLALLTASATWCFVRACRLSSDGDGRFLRAPAFRYWVCFGILAGLAMYTQQLAAFYLATIGLVPFIRRQPQQIAGIALGTMIALIVYFPWLVNIPSQLQKVSSYYWVQKPTLGSLLLTFRSFLAVNADIPAPFSIIALVGALFLLLFLCAQWVLYLRRPRRQAQSDAPSIALVLWLALAPVALMWIVSQVQPVYLDRALIPSAMMLYLALGWLFTRSGLPRPMTALLGIVAGVLCVIGLYYQYTWATFPNSPFEQAITYIRRNQQVGDVVVHSNKLSALPMIYYDRTLTQRYIGDARGSPEDTLALPTQEALQLLADACIQAAARDAEGVWFVVFARAQEQYEAAGRTELRDAFAWLGAHFAQTEQIAFNDLLVYRYTQPLAEFSPDCETR